MIDNLINETINPEINRVNTFLNEAFTQLLDKRFCN
jgi:hypothetical protein